MKIGILTDSTACLSDDYVNENKIKVASLKIIIGDKTYDELDGISLDEVFKQIDSSVKVTSSQPSPEDFVKLYEEFKTEGYTDVIAIHISSNVSGTLQSSNIAKNIVTDLNIHIFDSGSSSVEEELYIDRVINLIKEGKNADYIMSDLKKMKENTSIILTIDDLNTLVAGGRMSKTQAKIGNFLKIKPMITLVDGKLELFDKARTKKKVLAKIIKSIEADLEKYGELIVNVTHIKSVDFAYYIKEKIEDISSKIEVKIAEEIGPVLALHFGRGGFAIAWTPKR